MRTFGPITQVSTVNSQPLHSISTRALLNTTCSIPGPSEITTVPPPHPTVSHFCQSDIHFTHSNIILCSHVVTHPVHQSKVCGLWPLPTCMIVCIWRVAFICHFKSHYDSNSLALLQIASSSFPSLLTCIGYTVCVQTEALALNNIVHWSLVLSILNGVPKL